MSQSATEKTNKTPARLSKSRVIKTMTKLAGKLEEDSSTGLPTIKIAGGLLSIDVSEDKGGLCVFGYWGGAVRFNPDRQPLRMEVNELNGGGISGNLVAEPCGSSTMHTHLLVLAPPYLPSTATNAQLKSIIAGYAAEMSAVFARLDEQFPEEPSKPRKGSGLKPVSPHYFSEAFGVSAVGMWRVHERATRLAMIGTPVHVVDHRNGAVSILINEHAITIESARDGSGDIELRLVTPSGRCACDLDALVRWAEFMNDDQYVYSARIEVVNLDGGDGQDLVLVTTARIPTKWGYTDEQLDWQLSTLVSQLVGAGEAFYRTFNPTRVMRYIDHAA